jgi:two-component system nitrate/nitrite response regulator NarL
MQDSGLSNSPNIIKSSPDQVGLGGPKRPRVVIAEDYVVIQEHIKSVLTPECDVVAAVEDGESALAAIRDHQPDVLLTDVSLPEMSGFAVAQKLTEIGSSVKVIFLTAHRDKNYAERAFDIGVKGYVLKASMLSELNAAIRTVMEGGTYLSPLIP